MLHLKVRAFVIAFILTFSLSLPNAQAADDITINGITFYKDGKPWIAKGVKIEAFARPAIVPVSESSPAWMNKPDPNSGRGVWGNAELSAAKTVFGADTLRFAISQPALDSQSTIYDPKYLAEVVGAMRQARAAGFVVIPSMDAQDENGVLKLSCMPNDSTVRAWQTLTPYVRNDPGIMFELFDEPCKPGNPQNIQEVAALMQSIINAVRGSGANNILLVDGLNWARYFPGLFPSLRDSIPNRLALAVHPYMVAANFYASPADWNKQFGTDAQKYPMIASEWNATPKNGCIGPDTPQAALELVRYIQSLRIGLIVWAIDSPGKLVKDHTNFTPTDFTDFKDCKDGSISGVGQLLVRFPNN